MFVCLLFWSVISLDLRFCVWNRLCPAIWKQGFIALAGTVFLIKQAVLGNLKAGFHCARWHCFLMKNYVIVVAFKFFEKLRFKEYMACPCCRLSGRQRHLAAVCVKFKQFFHCLRLFIYLFANLVKRMYISVIFLDKKR